MNISKYKMYVFLTCPVIVFMFASYHNFFKESFPSKAVEWLTMPKTQIPSREISPKFKSRMPFKCTTQQTCKLKQEEIKKMLGSGFVNLTGLTLTPSARLLPSESKSVNHQAPSNPLDAGNETTSTIEVVNRKSEYREGDRVTVLVTIRDGNGKLTRHGGDQVRMWMVDKQRGAFLATEVVDLGNGSYTAVIPLAWSGYVSIQASLAYNSLTQRAHYFVRNIAKSLRYTGAIFTTYFSKEVTLCSPFPTIPGYSKMCNFTKENGGSPWFCGMPMERTLKCRHWALNFDFGFISPLPGTEAEHTWWEWIKKNGPRKVYGSGIEFNVKEREKGSKGKTKIPCEKIHLRDSWNSRAPRGHFINERWIPATCTLDTLTPHRINRCLGNITVVITGDSNARLLFLQLASLTKCATTGEKQFWHKPLVCTNIKKHTEIRWNSHALPFHTGSRGADERTNQKASNDYIDEIPSEGRFWVVVHLYSHYTPHRDEVFLTHMRAVRASVERLLQRNSEAKVIIRGPHTFRQQPWVTPEGGDIVLPHYTAYIKKEFENIQDRVFFLQPWDMTVAIESTQIHPPDYVTKALVDLILGHMCE